MRFASIELDLPRRELRRDGRPVGVEPRVFDFLVYLARRAECVVSREELTRQLWGDTAVSYWALARLVKEARHAIGDVGHEERLLETVRGRGFRLAARVAPSQGGVVAAGPSVGAEVAVDLARRAAASTSGRRAHAEAANQLRSALELGGDDDLEQVVDLGEALVRSYAVEEGRSLLWSAAERAEAARRPDLVARVALAYCGVEESPIPDLKRIALLLRAVAGLPTDAAEDRVRLLGRLARATCLSSSPRRRGALADRVMDEARATDREDLRCDALASVHLGAWTPDNLDQREAWAREQLALARRLGDPIRLHDARMDLVADLLERGDRCGVDALIEEHDRDAEGSGNLLLEWHAEQYACLLALLDRRFAAAEQALERAQALGVQAGYEIAEAWHAVQLFTLFRERGCLGELAPAVEAFAASQPLPAWEVASALASAEAGRLEAGRAAVRRYLTDGCVRLPRDFTWLVAACALLEVCRRLDDAAAESATRRALEPYADRHASLHAMTSWGPVSGLLAGQAAGL